MLEFGNGIITYSHQCFLAGSSKPLAKDDELQKGSGHEPWMNHTAHIVRGARAGNYCLTHTTA